MAKQAAALDSQDAPRKRISETSIHRRIATTTRIRKAPTTTQAKARGKGSFINVVLVVAA